MKISIAADHAGFAQKEQLKEYLAKNGHEVIDRGTYKEERVDYPDFAKKVAHDVLTGEADRGVLVCGTGIGMAIVANKIRGIRAANVTSPLFSELSRQHNDTNVLCISGRFVDILTNEQIVDTFLDTAFEGGRHADRIGKFESS